MNTDSELRGLQISGSRWNRARRLMISELLRESVESFCAREGHMPPPNTRDFAKGRCVRCYALLTPEASNGQV